MADKKHAAAWHGWAKLELRADNVKRARSLLNKGLKFCGANEYLLQTLALIESRAGKLEQARSLLARATQHNPKSAASWLVSIGKVLCPLFTNHSDVPAANRCRSGKSLVRSEHRRNQTFLQFVGMAGLGADGIAKWPS